MIKEQPLKIQQRPLHSIMVMQRAGKISIFEALYGIEHSSQVLPADKAARFYRHIESDLLKFAKTENIGVGIAIEHLPILARRFLPADQLEPVYDTVRDLILQKHVGPSSSLGAHEAYPAAAANAIIGVANNLVPSAHREEVLKRDLQPLLELALTRAESAELRDNEPVLVQSAAAASVIANTLRMKGHKDQRLWVSETPTGRTGSKPALGVALLRTFNAKGTVVVDSGIGVDYIEEMLKDDRNGEFSNNRKAFLAAVAGRNHKVEVPKAAPAVFVPPPQRAMELRV